MIAALAKSMLIGTVRRRAGVPQPGALTAALITGGASLLLSRGRRPIGLALLAAGGLLLWREAERERAAQEAAPGATGATGPSS